MYRGPTRRTLYERIMLNQHSRLDLKVQLELEHLLRYQLLLSAFNLNLLQSQSLQQDVHGILLNILLTL